MTAFAAAIAVNRFGLGARPGEPLPADPRGWLGEQLARFDAAPPAIAALPGSAAMAGRFRGYLADIKAARAMPAAAPGEPPAAKAVREALRQQYRSGYGGQAQARLAAALTTPAPFAERLTHFWANHFAVSADKLQTVGLAGTLEFEAVRPQLFGKFADLLLAVERHPAMLLYLDQAQSIGPDSAIAAAAARRPKAKPLGLNENLAREILELHTLGVGGGYAQADVQELARAMTGWSAGGFVRQPLGIDAPDGSFVFQPGWHQPGARTLLGRRYADAGYAQAEAMLRDLAVHPATATHLATKLARQFVADTPPPALVARLARVHVETGGDLKSLYATLVAAPESWAVPLAKFKTPWDWTVSSLRGLGVTAVPDLKAVGAVAELGQPVWKPGSPAGWDDTAPSWAAPDALLRRVEVAARLGNQVGDRLDARTLGSQLLPGVLTPATAQAIARAATPAQGLALLLVAPEFLRR